MMAQPCIADSFSKWNAPLMDAPMGVGGSGGSSLEEVHAAK